MTKVTAERRPIRLLMVSISFDPEPGAVHGLPLAKWLAATRQYDVQVLTAVPWYPLGRTYPGYRMRPQRQVIDGIPVLRVPLFPSHDLNALRRIATYASFMCSAIVFGLPRIRRPDVIYYFDNLPTTGAVARLAARLTGARTVQHIADLWPDTVTQSGMIRNPHMLRIVEAALNRWCGSLYRRHARITVLSPGFKRLLVERGVPERKIQVVYNWADEARFRPEPRDAWLAEQLGFAGRMNLLYAGNIGPMQSVHTLLDAAQRLVDLSDVQFVIAGMGPCEAEVRAHAEKLRLENVRFLGRLPLEQMNRVNALADALVVHLRDVPMLRSTIPSKIQVALASARPLLVGVKGDAAELVARAGAGFCFEPENADDLAAVTRRFVALSNEQRDRMAAAGRAFYDRVISLDAGGSRMDAVFRSALQRTAEPVPARTGALP